MAEMLLMSGRFIRRMFSFCVPGTVERSREGSWNIAQRGGEDPTLSLAARQVHFWISDFCVGGWTE